LTRADQPSSCSKDKSRRSPPSLISSAMNMVEMPLPNSTIVRRPLIAMSFSRQISALGRIADCDQGT
jgi:hypothetical protein